MRPHEIEFSTFDGPTFQDVMPYQFGREVCSPGHAFGPARRNHPLFHLVISGHGTFTDIDESGESSAWRLGPGDGYMILPGETTLYTADLDDPWEYIWLEMDGTHVRNVLRELGFTPSSPIYRARTEEGAAELHRAMQDLLDHRSDQAFALVGRTYLVLDAFQRSAASHRNATQNLLHGFYIDSALTFIDENYQNDISIADIARNTGLDRSYFGKVFKEVMGATPQQFLIGYRMEKACDLLRLTGLSIAEVGAAVGYPNQLHFSRAFKQVKGSSPRAWRHEHAPRA